jgi:hypothetical protein
VKIEKRAAVPEVMSVLESNLSALIKSGAQERDIDPHYVPQMATVSVGQVAEDLTLFVRAIGLFPADQQPRVRPLRWDAIYVEEGPHNAALYALERHGVEPLYFSVSRTLVRLVNGMG